MRDIRILITSFLIIVSFFAGYMFAVLENEKKYEDEIQRVKYVEIKTSKTKISFGSAEKNLRFMVDGKPSESQEILYQKK